MFLQDDSCLYVNIRKLGSFILVKVINHVRECTIIATENMTDLFLKNQKKIGQNCKKRCI